MEIDYNELMSWIQDEETSGDQELSYALNDRIFAFLMARRSKLGKEADAFSNGNFFKTKQALLNAVNKSYTAETLENLVKHGARGLGVIGSINISIANYVVPPYFNGLDYTDYDGAELHLANAQRMFACQEGFIYIAVHVDDSENWVYVPLNVIKWNPDNIMGQILKLGGCLGVALDHLDSSIRRKHDHTTGLMVNNYPYQPSAIAGFIKAMYLPVNTKTNRNPSDFCTTPMTCDIPVWTATGKVGRQPDVGRKSYRIAVAIAWAIYKSTLLAEVVEEVKALRTKQFKDDRVEALELIAKTFRKASAKLRTDAVAAALTWYDGTALGNSKIIYELSALAENFTNELREITVYQRRLDYFGNEGLNYHIPYLFAECTHATRMFNWLCGEDNDSTEEFSRQSTNMRRIVQSAADGLYYVRGILENFEEVRDVYHKILPPTYTTADFLYCLHKDYKHLCSIDNDLVNNTDKGPVMKRVKDLLKSVGVIEEPWFSVTAHSIGLPKEAFTLKDCLPYITTKRYANIKDVPRFIFSPRGARLASTTINIEKQGERPPLSMVHPGMYTDGLKRCDSKLRIREQINKDLLGEDNDGS